MTDTLATAVSSNAASQGGVPQQRRIVTAIPGPKSNAIHERRNAAVASGAASDRKRHV